MDPSNDGDDQEDVAQIVREQREDDALAKRLEEQGHTLLPPEIAEKLPALHANEGQGEEAIAHLKLFTPWTNWTWYASEYDPRVQIFFGVIVGDERELGYFSLDELQAIKGPAGLKIERDLFWTPRPLKECR
jgi:hypothetical protein